MPAPPRKLHTSARAQRRLRALLFLGALLPPLMFFALGAYALRESHAQFEQRAELLTQNLAEALERSLTANVEKIDMALNSVVDHLEMQLARGGIHVPVANAHLRSQIANRAELEGLGVTDEQGLLILGRATAAVGLKPMSFADSAWFTVHRDQPDTGLYMSGPVVSKLAGNWIVSLSRRYRHADGRFAGAVSAAVPLSYFQSQLQAVNAGPNGMVILRDLNLNLLARFPDAPSAQAETVGSRRASAQLRGLVNSGSAGATYRAASPTDGVEHTFSYRRLGLVPLVVIVGAGSQDYLADWYAQQRAVVALCVGMVLLYSAGGVVLWRLRRQNRQARQRIELLAKVFEHSGEAIMVTDREHRVVEVNPAFVRQTGYTPAEIVGQLPAKLNAPQTTAADIEAMQRCVQATGVWRGERWDRAKDGRLYPKWLSISVLRDADGEVTHHIANSIDVTEAKQAEDRIRHLAHHDTLTQLPNRVLLHGRLEQAMATARRDSGQLAMLFIDMDRFKDINDTLGHPVGDGLLVEVGRRLSALVRESDVVARLGGDE